MADAVAATRRHDDAFNAHDADARMASETPDIETILPGGITLRGHQEVVSFLAIFWEALPDAKVTYEGAVAAGDTVVIEGTFGGHAHRHVPRASG